MKQWLAWLDNHAGVIGWLVAGSAILFLASLVVLPLIVVRIPQDYFTHTRRPRPTWIPKHGLLRIMALVLKNLGGVVLIVAGMAMLVLPGQGLLTVLVGVLLIDFPGKYRLERWLVSRGHTLRGINWLRRRANREPLVIEE
jgi:hypothetical protein